MRFYLDKQKNALEVSFFDYIWRKYGYTLGKDKCVFFKANKAPNPDKKKFCSVDSYYRYLRCDSNYINILENLPYYDKPIKKYGASVIFGYPSSVSQLAKAYSRSNIEPPKFRLALLASENVYDWQLELISEVFDTKQVFFHYGHSEQVLLAFKTSEDNRMQLVPQYGYGELLGPEGNVIEKPGYTGELIGTGYALGMPFIRYATKDYATLSENQNGIFPKGLVLDRIEGRLQEFVVTSDGRLISICTIGGFHFPELEIALHMQYYQEKPGLLELRYVEDPAKQMTEEMRASVRAAFLEAFNGTLDVKLVPVESIVLTQQNKKQMLIQKLQIERFL